MQFIKNNKAAIVFYLVLVAGVLLISENNKKYDCYELENAQSYYEK